MKTNKFITLAAALMLLPAVTLRAQTAPLKTSGTAVKKAAGKSAAKRAVKPAVKPGGVSVSTAAPKAVPPAAAVLKSTAPASPFDEAVEKLGSKDSVLRRQGADLLGASRDQKAGPYLVKALSDETGAVRSSAVDGLCQLVYKQATGNISELLLKDKDVLVRQQAASSLSYMLDASAGPALIKALKDSSNSVRYAAANTLGSMKYAPAEDALMGLLSEPLMRRVAISALGQLQSVNASSAIFHYLSDADKYTRLEAVRALGAIGDKSSAKEIEKHLGKTEEPSVRVEAALALAKMGSPAGLVTSYEFVKSPDISLKNQALEVVGAVGDARSLQFIEELYNAEKDPVNRSMLDFTRQRLAARQKMQQKKP